TGQAESSDLIAGLDWVTGKLVTGVFQGASRRPAVVNISMTVSSGISAIKALSQMTGLGATVVVAAGNSHENTCGSVNDISGVITVGASTKFDGAAGFSNYGSCLDLYAPGDGIRIATRNGGYGGDSGTSFSAPYVAGVSALLKSKYSAMKFDPPGLESYMKNVLATSNMIQGAPSGTTRNLLHKPQYL
ncbi:S8 family serine peptidase, partial [Streptomyces sp. SID5770]|uniref:S8 family serine peptidase n=1 Tax=Streptomyces sp. SID5770 TaxID=2690308 RepID=UPI001385F960